MRFDPLRWSRSLTARLLASHLVMLLLLSLLLIGGPLLLLRLNLPGLANRALSEEADDITARLRYDDQGEPTSVALDAESAWLYEGFPHELGYRLLDSDGKVLLSSDPDVRTLGPATGPVDPQRPVFDVERAGVILHVGTRAVEHDGRRWMLQVAISDRMAKLTRLGHGYFYIRAAAVPLVLALLGFVVVVVIAVRRVIKPLREASLAAAQIAPRNLGARLDSERLPSELAPLIAAFNSALARLEKGFRVQQDFLATSAHELKTPLALIRGQLELDVELNRARLLQDVDVINRQVQQLLDLAEVSDERNYDIVPTDLLVAIVDVVDYLRPLADHSAVHLEVDAPAAERDIQADPSALFVLLKNLLENAIQHAPAGSRIRVAMATPTHLSIADQGRGVAESDLPRLFERFWRGRERADQGAGLGLSICREIALAHGWTLEASNTSEGAEFRLVFASLVQ